MDRGSSPVAIKSPLLDCTCHSLSSFAKAPWEVSRALFHHSLQVLGWRPFLSLEFFEAWDHGSFLMAGSTIDLDFLKYFFFFLLEIYACFWHLPCSLWTLRQRIHLIIFFASSGSKFPLPFPWPLAPYVLKNVLFVSTSFVIYLAFILHLCLSYHFLHCLDFPL